MFICHYKLVMDVNCNNVKSSKKQKPNLYNHIQCGRQYPATKYELPFGNAIVNTITTISASLVRARNRGNRLHLEYNYHQPVVIMYQQTSRDMFMQTHRPVV